MVQLMSNRRRPARGNRYRSGYLRSVAWFRRRDAWFAEEITRNGTARCCVCDRPGVKRTLELHHLEYSGVSEGPDGWVAGEVHEDLVAAHPRCHEWIHKLLDRDDAFGGLMSRRSANLQVISRLRSKIAAQLEHWSKS